MFASKVIAVIVLLLALISTAHAQTKTPVSNDPPLTGSASAPVNIPVNRTPNSLPDSDGPTPPPVATPTFTYSLTGKDLDTYNVSGTQTQEYDPFTICVPTLTGQAWTDVSRPVQRGIGPDGTFTWDVVGNGTVKKEAAHLPKAQVYINTYAITNLREPTDVLLDKPVGVNQTLILNY